MDSKLYWKIVLIVGILCAFVDGFDGSLLAYLVCGMIFALPVYALIGGRVDSPTNNSNDSFEKDWDEDFDSYIDDDNRNGRY